MASIEESRKMKVLVFNNCRKNHTGTCWKVVKAYYNYGAHDHFKRDCPIRGGKKTEHNVQFATEPQLEVKTKTLMKSRSIEGASRRNVVKLGPNALAKVYIMKVKEDVEALDVITGKFSLFDNNIRALINPGSIHTYIYVISL